MERLVLPGAAEGAETGSARLPDPRSLPRITVSAGQFSLGDRHLGSLRADFLRTALGLEADSFIAESASFDINGRAGWIVDDSDPARQRSYLEARLTSSNVERQRQSERQRRRGRVRRTHHPVSPLPTHRLL